MCRTAGGDAVRLDCMTGTRIGQWGWPAPQQQQSAVLIADTTTGVFKRLSMHAFPPHSGHMARKNNPTHEVSGAASGARSCVPKLF